MSATKISRDGEAIAGFSLISMCLFLVAVGLFTTAGIFLGKQYSFAQKQDLSVTNVALVEQALEAYRAQNGRLPCPAPLTAEVDTKTFGVADASANCAGIENPVVGRANGAVRFGAVPVRTLGLPDKALVDGWNHRLLYAVTEYYTSNAPDFDADKGAIRIVDAMGENMTPDLDNNSKIASEQGRIIYAVISPGADERGAYNLAGKPLGDCPTDASVLARENCDKNNATFRSAVMRQWDTGTTTLTSSVKYATVQKSYAWHVSEFSPCNCTDHAPGDVNKPIQTRTVECQDNEGNPANGKCQGVTKPQETQYCVAYCWRTIPSTTVCTCANVGEKYTDVLECDRKYNGVTPPPVVDNADCASFEGPRTPAAGTCTDPGWCNACRPPVYSGSSGGGSSSGGSSGGSGIDVDYDGQADYNNAAEASQAGYSGVDMRDVNNDVNGASGPTANHYSGGSSSGGGGHEQSTDSRVICTHFYRRRRLSEELWRADLEFTFAHLSPATIRGYQFWAIPYVRWMRRSKFAEALMYPIARHRAEEIAYQMGLRNKPNYLGKLFRLMIEPVCFVIGLLVPEQNWQSLYQKDKAIELGAK